ncbi:deoxycytidylate deaminase-like [Saccostrea echinata]|uniref:deoxycytidylate deaminase-like n=1 Tax=Saccostrea echinata TaxID=191078 RepID=UPI002A7F2267|nr:deoxycytidylate deaminase-like [Saccostrea echinata]
MSENQEPDETNKKISEDNSKQRITADITYHEYFMAIACLSAKRSKDQKRKVGACIVNEKNRIVSTGYNGFVDSIKNNDETFDWSDNKKNLYVCHAEMNAVANRHCTDLKDCTIYVTLFLCNECTKLLLQSGIKRVIYYADDKLKAEEDNQKKADEGKYMASKEMLDKSGVELVQYKDLEDEDGSPLNPKRNIILSFDEIALQKQT